LCIAVRSRRPFDSIRSNTDIATKAMGRRETLAVPEGGPDICFCLRTTSRDPNVLQQCESVIPEDWTPENLTKKIVECGR
jgi:hypothetical protein